MRKKKKKNVGKGKFLPPWVRVKNNPGSTDCIRGNGKKRLEQAGNRKKRRKGETDIKHRRREEGGGRKRRGGRKLLGGSTKMEIEGERKDEMQKEKGKNWGEKQWSRKKRTSRPGDRTKHSKPCKKVKVQKEQRHKEKKSRTGGKKRVRKEMSFVKRDSL